MGENPEKYRALFEHIMDAVLLTSPDGSILAANPAACRMFGRTEEELCRIGRNVLVESEDSMFKDALQQTKLSGKYRGELTFMQKNGKKFSGEITISTFEDKDGLIITSMTIRDMNERKLAEKALRESEEKYKALYNNALVAMYRTSIKDGKALAANDVAVRLFGYSSLEELLSEFKATEHYVNTKDRKKLLDELKRKGRVHNFQVEFKRKDGTVFWEELSAKIYPDKGYIEGVVIDITKRRQAEEALRESRQMLQTVLDSIPSAVFWKDRDLFYLGGNQTFLEATGMGSSEELIGKSDYDLPWDKEEAEKYRETDRRVMESGVTDQGIIEPYHRADGTRAWAKTNKVPMRDTEGIITGILGTYEDITEQKQAEERIIHLNKLLLAIRNVNQLITVEKDRDRLLAGACENLVENQSCYGAWIALTDKAGKVIQGFEAEPDKKRSTINGLLIPGKKPPECAQKALLQPELVIIQATDHNYPDCPFSKNKHGYGSLIVRLECDGQVFGVMAISLPADLLADQEQQALFREIAGDIGFALKNQEIEKARIRAVKALREEKNRAQKYLDVADVMLVVLGVDQKVSLINKKGCEILGCQEEEIIGKNWFDNFLPGKYGKEVKEVFRKVVAGDIKEIEYHENSVLACDGTEKIIAWHNTILRDDTGRVIGTLSSGEDITERRRAEVALDQFKTTLDQTLDCVFMFDPETLKFFYVNQGAIDQIGYSREEFLKMTPVDIKPKYSEKRFRELIAPLLEGEKASQTFETVHKHKDGRLIPVEVFIQYVLPPGEHGRFVATVRDLSERKQLEEELIKAEKLESIGVLAGGIAHDFNNILTSVLGNISLARISGPEELDRILTEAEKAGLRAKDLTRQLLTFSKGGAPAKQVASLGEIIRDSTHFPLRGSNVKCNFSIPEDLWPAEVDAGQISQVIGNLVINADQAMPEGGIIEIIAENIIVGPKDFSLLHKGKYINITISDHGQGIPEQLLRKIFDPYFTTKRSGTGLGLASAYSIVKKHGGHIAVESVPKIGTAFHVYLPASSEKIKKTKKVQEEDHFIKGKILVMDDEKPVREVVASMLEYMGHKVKTAVDGIEAVGLYEKSLKSGRPFDVVILDLTVPGAMGGKETIKQLLAIDPNVIAIVSSGYSKNRVLSDFAKYGFSGIVSKPYNLETLRKELNKVLIKKGE
jgi:PAS domain S-box-containing protein